MDIDFSTGDGLSSVNQLNQDLEGLFIVDPDTPLLSNELLCNETIKLIHHEAEATPTSSMADEDWLSLGQSREQSPSSNPEDWKAALPVDITRYAGAFNSAAMELGNDAVILEPGSFRTEEPWLNSSLWPYELSNPYSSEEFDKSLSYEVASKPQASYECDLCDRKFCDYRSFKYEKRVLPQYERN